MTTIKIIIILTFVTLLTGCGPDNKITPKSFYDNPFPKKNKDLTKILGEKLTIKRGSDTLYYTISSNNNLNFILNSKTGDTAFKVTVCKFRGLYYFSQKFNDTTYWINAVKIKDNLIFGFGSDFWQMLQLDDEIKSGKSKKLVSYINSDTSVIRLHPDKREMKYFYNAIILNEIPDTIISLDNYFASTIDTSKIATQVDPEENVILSRAYPNPTTDIINIELQQKRNVSFLLSDINGKTIQQGQFSKTSNQLDIKNQPTGIYILTLLNATDKQKENIKIIKTE